MIDCCVCGLGGGCLYTVRECSDHAHFATVGQVINRLNNGEFKNDTDKMIKYLLDRHNIIYRTNTIPQKGGEIMLDITKDEAHAVCELIDMTFIDEIRRNDNVDNMYWIRNVIHTYEKLCAYSGYVELTEPNPGDAE